MTNAFTKSIAIFEDDAAQSRAEYAKESMSNTNISLLRILQRDEAQERALWAIELLHAANVKQQERLVGQCSDIAPKNIFENIF